MIKILKKNLKYLYLLLLISIAINITVKFIIDERLQIDDILKNKNNYYVLKDNILFKYSKNNKKIVKKKLKMRYDGILKGNKKIFLYKNSGILKDLKNNKKCNIESFEKIKYLKDKYYTLNNKTIYKYNNDFKKNGFFKLENKPVDLFCFKKKIFYSIFNSNKLYELTNKNTNYVLFDDNLIKKNITITNIQQYNGKVFFIGTKDDKIKFYSYDKNSKKVMVSSSKYNKKVPYIYDNNKFIVYSYKKLRFDVYDLNKNELLKNNEYKFNIVVEKLRDEIIHLIFLAAITYFSIVMSMFLLLIYYFNIVVRGRSKND